MRARFENDPPATPDPVSLTVYRGGKRAMLESMARELERRGWRVVRLYADSAQGANVANDGGNVPKGAHEVSHALE